MTHGIPVDITNPFANKESDLRIIITDFTTMMCS